MSSAFRSVTVCLLLAGLAGCERKDRKVHEVASPGKLERPIAMQGELQPGPPGSASRFVNPFDGDAVAIAEGRRLYNWYNCAGCHFNGGGGMGPPLMDDEWIYGAQPENIYDSIHRGRPNGMPAFGGRIPEVQMWKIVAFVGSLNPDQKGQGSAVRPEGGSNR